MFHCVHQICQAVCAKCVWKSGGDSVDILTPF